MRRNTKTTLKPYIPMSSDRTCYSCDKKKRSALFSRRGNICLECRSKKAADRINRMKETYNKASGDCWWLTCYFTIAEKELSFINRYFG